MAFKRRGESHLRWVGVEVTTSPWQAYKLVMASAAARRLLLSGYREYGIQGLNERS